jgi:PAS domain-containing protein
MAASAETRIARDQLEIPHEQLQRRYRQIQKALARFTAFFNGLLVAGLVVDGQGLIIDANLVAQRLFRLGDVHLGQHFFARLIEDEGRGAVIDAWSTLTAKQMLGLSEIRFRAGDSGFVGDLHLAALPTFADQPAQSVATHVSVFLARRRDEERLREIRERYPVLAEFSSDWEYWLAPDGRYLYVSPACAKITAYEAADFLAVLIC